MPDGTRRAGPPAVRFPVERPLAALLIGSLAVAAGAATLLAWFSFAQRLGWLHAAGGCVWAIASAWWFVSWRSSPRGFLLWTGAEWRWSPRTAPAAESAGRLVVHLDVQWLMLAAWYPSDGKAAMHWFWLERRTHPLHWHDLRRAVHSPAAVHGAPATSPGAGPALAPP